MKNATMLYRCPGSEEFEGVKCATLIVEAEEVEAAKAEGWCSDWMQAKAAHDEAAAKLAAVEAEQAQIAAQLAEQQRLEEHVAMEHAAQAERDPNAETGDGEQTAEGAADKASICAVLDAAGVKYDKRLSATKLAALLPK